MTITHRHRKSVLPNNPLGINVAENTSGLPVLMQVPELAEIGRVPRALIGIALPAQSLEIRQIVGASFFAGNNVIHFQGTFLVGDAAQFTAAPRAFQDFIAHAAWDVTCSKGAMREYGGTPLLHILVHLRVA